MASAERLPEPARNADDWRGLWDTVAECDEVANLVTYLASPLAHFVNGTMIEIDGGQQKPVMDASRDG